MNYEQFTRHQFEIVDETICHRPSRFTYLPMISSVMVRGVPVLKLTVLVNFTTAESSVRLTNLGLLMIFEAILGSGLTFANDSFLFIGLPSLSLSMGFPA